MKLPDTDLLYKKIRVEMRIKMDNIDKELRKILKNIVDDEELKERIDTKDNLKFIDDLDFDSVDIMKLVVEVEEKFNVQVSEENNFIDIIKDLKSVKKWLEEKQ